MTPPPFSVLRVAVGALNQNTLSEHEVKTRKKQRFQHSRSMEANSLFTISTLSPVILGDPDVYSLEIGGDEGDVYARFRWLERDPWFFKEWQNDHGLD